MINLILGIGILFLCYSLGRKALSGFRIAAAPDETIVFGAGLGLGILAYAVLMLGLTSFLNPWTLRGVLILMFLLCLPSLKQDWDCLRKGTGTWKIRLDYSSGMMIGFFLVAAAALTAGVLAPETSNDSLCYHLHLPKIFLKEHRIGYLPYEFNSLFPLSMEMLDTLALGIGVPGGHPFWGGMVLAKFFHLATGLIAAGAIIALIRRHAKTGWAWYGAFLWLTTPLIVNQMGTTYIDVALGAYCLLSFSAFLRWLDSPQPGWMILAGIFAGFALGVKYLALIAVFGIFLFLMGLLFAGRDRKETTRGIFYFIAAVFAAGGYWYIRSYIQLGNPVYPYFYQIFKSGDPTIQYNDIGVPKTLINFFLIPWNVTMHPEKFEGYGVQIGPAVLAFLPAAIVLGRRKIPHFGFMTFFCLFYLVLWFLLGQSLRFLLPLLPVLIVMTMIGLSEALDETMVGKGLRFLLGFILFIHAGLAVYHYRESFRVALGLESRDHYLSLTERSYEVAQWINKNLPPQAKILCADESHLYFYDRTVARESVYAMRTGYDQRASSFAGTVKLLRQEGFTHLLILEGADREAWKDDAPFRITRLAHERENELALYFDPIYTKRFRSPEGNETLYQLYQFRKI